MADLKFDPVVGLEVRIRGDRELFEIIAVHPPNSTTMPEGWESFAQVRGEGGRTVDLKFLRSDSHLFSPLQNVPWSWLQYADESEIWPVRHAIEWLKTNPDGKKYPDYVVDYEVEAKNDQSGNPSIFVRFLVEPEYFYENGSPSKRNMAALSEFVFEVDQVLLGLDLDRWIYVQSGVARRVLDVAS
ncbi:MAG TPA: hypothetical protein VGF01_01260 [Terracidiphilus sp.]|jgi:hypothetical protein